MPDDAAALLAQAGQADFQLSLPWWQNLVATVDFSPAEPRWYVWRVQGRAEIVLPLSRRRRLGATVLSSLGNYYTTRWAPIGRAEVVGDPATLSPMIAAILRHEAPVAQLRCHALASDDPVEAALRRALRHSGCAVFGYFAFANWQLPVRQSWPDYLASREGRLRTTLQRMGKRFAARGGRIELIDGGDRLEAAIAAYEQVYAASWKTAEPHPGFMPGLIRAAAATGRLRMAVAWLNSRPAAAQVWLQSGRRADIYKLAHDEEFRDLSPGSLLTASLMAQAFERDAVDTVDYLSGDDAYKRLWMTERHERRGLVAYPLGTIAGALGAARETMALLRRGGRRTPQPSEAKP